MYRNRESGYSVAPQSLLRTRRRASRAKVVVSAVSACVVVLPVAGCSTSGDGGAASTLQQSTTSAFASSATRTQTTKRTANPGPNSIVILDGRVYPRKLRVAECTMVTVTNMDAVPMRLYDRGSIAKNDGGNIEVPIAAGASAYFTAPNRDFLFLILDSDKPIRIEGDSAKSQVELRIDDNMYKNCTQHGVVR